MLKLFGFPMEKTSLHIPRRRVNKKIIPHGWPLRIDLQACAEEYELHKTIARLNSIPRGAILKRSPSDSLKISAVGVQIAWSRGEII